MELLFFFIIGMVYGKYLDPLIDALVQCLISYINVKISKNNNKITDSMSQTHAIGFVCDNGELEECDDFCRKG